jgi:ubiquinone biosynthesis protein Coq4
MGQNMHLLEDFIGARKKHSKNMEYCVLRKLGPEVFSRTDVDGQHQEMLELLKDAEGDPKELERYKALESYPAGSLGKGFWDFYAQFAWPLPGDQHWISEELTVRHDLIHVLCSYDISINGEFQVAAFTAGNSQLFNWMIATLGLLPPTFQSGSNFLRPIFSKLILAAKTPKKALSITGTFGRKWHSR